jgi:hypothetical protein
VLEIDKQGRRFIVVVHPELRIRAGTRFVRAHGSDAMTAARRAMLFALSVFVPNRWVTQDAHDLVCLLAIGLIGYVGLLAIDHSAAAAPVGLTAPLAACQIPMTQALSAMFGYGKTAWGTWAAMALIGASTLLGSWHGKHLSAEHAFD